MTKTIINEITPVINKISKQNSYYQQKYQYLLSSISDNKSDSANNFLAYISYLDFEQEFNNLCENKNLPIAISKIEYFNNFFEVLKEISGIQFHFKTITNSKNKNADNFFKSNSSKKPHYIVNLQNEAETDINYLEKLLQHGANLFRLNSAFGTKKNWQTISDNLKIASENTGLKSRLLLDLSGPKIRISEIQEKSKSRNSIELSVGDNLKLTNSQFDFDNNKKNNNEIPIAKTSFNGSFVLCKIGETIRINDSRIFAEIVDIAKNFIKIRINSIDKFNKELTIGKGVNFPQSNLGISGLTSKDKTDINESSEFADVLCFSFVQSAADILEIETQIKKHRTIDLPLVIKIETQQAIDNLNEIVLASMRFPNLAILIARGDLVSECGWKALPVLQDKINKYAQAAHIPTILATEIMETYNQQAILTRSEIIDLYKAHDFNSILINKGRYIFETLTFADSFFAD